MTQYSRLMRGHQKKNTSTSRVGTAVVTTRRRPAETLVPATVEIKKHVKLIHCAGDLSLLERKTFNVLLLHAYDALLDDADHVISVPALFALIGYNSKDTTTIKKALQALLSKVITYDLLEEEGGSKDLKNAPWEAATLLSYASMSGGKVTYRFDRAQARRFFDPDVYSRINVAIQREFGSNYAIALHENCLRFRRTQSTGWWTISDLRLLLGATSPTYDDFRRLNNKVIKSAVAEVNRFSEITVEAEFKRDQDDRKKYSHVRFSIKENPQRSMFDPTDEATRDIRAKPAYKRLIALGLSDRLALTTVSQDEAFAWKVAEYTEPRVQSGKVKNPAAYAATLIKAQASLDESEAAQKKRAADEQDRAAEVRKRASDKAEENRRRGFLEFETRRREQVFANLKPDQRRALFSAFVATEGTTYRVASNTDPDSLSASQLQAFQRFVVRSTVGAATDADFEKYQRDGKVT